jgi:hypothetical protein
MNRDLWERGFRELPKWICCWIALSFWKTRWLS